MLNKKIVVDDSVLDVNASDLWHETVQPALIVAANKMINEDKVFYDSVDKLSNCIPGLLQDGEYEEVIEKTLPFLKVVQADSYLKKYPHLETQLKKDITFAIQQLVNFISVCKADTPPVPEEKIPRRQWQEKENI